MIDDELQDQASLYVLRMLPPDDALAFEKRMALDPALRAIVDQLESGAGYLAMTAPGVTPPPALKERILTEIRHEVRVVPMAMTGRLKWVPWALAAGLAVMASVFWQRSVSLRELNDAASSRTAQLETEARAREFRVAELEREARAQAVQVAELRSHDALSSLQIASLNAKVATYEKALAVVLFDAKQQRGLVKVDHIPQAAAGKDYQLWVIPAGGKPVSAGLVPVNDQGLTQVVFKPDTAVNAVDAFAISVEPRGGSVQPQGEIVLVGK